MDQPEDKDWEVLSWGSRSDMSDDIPMSEDGQEVVEEDVGVGQGELNTLGEINTVTNLATDERAHVDELLAQAGSELLTASRVTFNPSDGAGSSASAGITDSDDEEVAEQHIPKQAASGSGESSGQYMVADVATEPSLLDEAHAAAMSLSSHADDFMAEPFNSSLADMNKVCENEEQGQERGGYDSDGGGHREEGLLSAAWNVVVRTWKSTTAAFADGNAAVWSMGLACAVMGALLVGVICQNRRLAMQLRASEQAYLMQVLQLRQCLMHVRRVPVVKTSLPEIKSQRFSRA
eukprot:jgi/Chlat1/1997/Chrsp158S02288